MIAKQTPANSKDGEKMTSAVVMAGYNNKREVKRYSRIVAEHYGEKFIETGYKPLREFSTIVNGQQVSKPLIQYTLALGAIFLRSIPPSCVSVSGSR